MTKADKITGMEIDANASDIKKCLKSPITLGFPFTREVYRKLKELCIAQTSTKCC